MIKNESQILQRCLNSVINFVDAFCITDTGSTDDTYNIATTYIENSAKPGKLCKTIFQDFGTTRSESFEFTKSFVKELGWDLQTTFGLLLDADMIFRYSDFEIGEFDEYKIIQTQAGYDYNNTRFIRMSLDWKCVGSTHEYWNSSQKANIAVLTSKKIWIDDVSDGGCKNDKYERDIKLLKIDLEKAGNNNEIIKRSLFYLGQTYMCIVDYETAIDYFIKRVALKGWIEEVWYACLYIAMCYFNLKDTTNAIIWCKTARETDETRPEPFLLLSDIYNLLGQDEESMKYIELGIEYKKNPKNLMFTNTAIYEYRFLLAKFSTMLRIPTTSKKDVLETGMKLLNKLPFSHLTTCDAIISICNSLSMPIECVIESVKDNTELGISYFTQPNLEQISIGDTRLSLEKLGTSFILVEYGVDNRYSRPFVFPEINAICKSFYKRDDDLIFILQSRTQTYTLKVAKFEFI